ncbi:AbrB/MazE/SpoVT family DNA-binding domain-containing protein [Candidatus Gottesmanbacteria bacterium]|nr:AbrB/MazE/SpoVT family DNA-binding domain-containing protein [Candidatus Gottesmanbacteria bacterium]
MTSQILTISSQGQITVPKTIRDRIGIKPGAKIVVYLKKDLQGDIVVLEPKEKSWAKKLAGSGKNLWGNSDAYLKNERKSWGED